MSFSHFDNLLILSGVSGGGRSSALHFFSDLGFYALDNLPIGLFNHFIEVTKGSPEKFKRTALTLDTDFHTKAIELIALLDAVQNQENVQILFFDCETSTLLKRYSETRRPHPGFNSNFDKTLQDTIIRERAIISPIRNRANFVLDTTELNIHDLKREVRAYSDSLDLSAKGIVRVNFLSFGFKYAPPRDCDLIVDVRFLPNPFFIESLKHKDGTQKEVSDFVLENGDCKEFIERYTSLLNFLLPKYAHEGKSYINIGIGCTGGKHRSVAIAEHLATKLNPSGLNLAGFLFTVKHRDLS